MRKHTAAAAEMGNSGQIRDTKPKTGQWASRENYDFSGTSLKIGTVPENPGRMVTLMLSSLQF